MVCGAGINCVGVSAAGGLVRFPSVGEISGDWGGGAKLGTEALFLAVRAEDGPGHPTALREAIMKHFGTASVAEVTAALHFGELPRNRLHELGPVLLKVAATGDGPATGVVERQAEEVSFSFVLPSTASIWVINQPTSCSAEEYWPADTHSS